MTILCPEHDVNSLLHSPTEVFGGGTEMVEQRNFVGTKAVSRIGFRLLFPLGGRIFAFSTSDAQTLR